MFPTLACIVILAAAGMLAAAFGRHPVARICGAFGTMAASVLGIVAAMGVLLSGVVADFHCSWGGYGSLSFKIDALSALFLVPIWVISALAAWYAREYLEPYVGNKREGSHWCFYTFLVASMAGVVIANNVFTFLLAWELMALSSFFLVMFDGAKQHVREAGWVYLIATHLGTALVIPMFFILSAQAGSSEFDVMRTAAPDSQKAGILFLLAVVGFGTKAGIVPVHVWLPEAHPAAPTHVSALMSGVMIKTGIYAILRTTSFLGHPEIWWGATLVVVGIGSAVLGILFALAQHDAKRLLAYSSVENVGIIVTGIGLGMLGVAARMPALAALGFAGALLHVVNHAIFKGLLFLCVGSVERHTHTRELDQLGGLLRAMPWTGLCFLVGATAIVGLPPLNGFVSELLIYLGAFGAAGSSEPQVGALCAAVIAALALVGGLSAACFAKAFGIVFLGEPRSEAARHAREPGPSMRLPIAALGGFCVLLGLSGPLTVPRLKHAVACLIPDGLSSAATGPASPGGALATAGGALETTLLVVLTFALGVLILSLVRRGLLRGREVRTSETWGCGFTEPTPRMQYTGSSFGAPILEVFSPLVQTQKILSEPKGYFPETATFATQTPDVGRARLFGPLFAVIRDLLGRLRWLQRGHVHRYVLYVAVTLVVLLVWKL